MGLVAGERRKKWAKKEKIFVCPLVVALANV